jgi:hypothetical protein
MFEVSRLHSDTPHSVGLFWKSDRPVAETSSWWHTRRTIDRHPCLRRDSNPQSLASERLGGRWDRRIDTFKNGLKQGYAFSPLLFNFALHFTIRRIQANLDGVKLNGTHQLLVYADNVNILTGWKRTYYNKNTDALVVTSEETGLEVNAHMPPSEYRTISQYEDS